MDDYDMDVDHRMRNAGGKSGRIILLGDGTEVLTDSTEGDMFDNDGEDKDLESQVSGGQNDALASNDSTRIDREATPSPAAANPSSKQQTQNQQSTGSQEPSTSAVIEGPYKPGK